MTTYKHIVQVHPVENGEPNLYKVKWEKEFDTKELADWYIKTANDTIKEQGVEIQAVYVGRVNLATGELEWN